MIAYVSARTVLLLMLALANTYPCMFRFAEGDIPSHPVAFSSSASPSVSAAPIDAAFRLLGTRTVPLPPRQSIGEKIKSWLKKD